MGPAVASDLGVPLGTDKAPPGTSLLGATAGADPAPAEVSFLATAGRGCSEAILGRRSLAAGSTEGPAGVSGRRLRPDFREPLAGSLAEAPLATGLGAVATVFLTMTFGEGLRAAATGLLLLLLALGDGGGMTCGRAQVHAQVHDLIGVAATVAKDRVKTGADCDL